MDWCIIKTVFSGYTPVKLHFEEIAFKRIKNHHRLLGQTNNNVMEELIYLYME